MTIEYKANIQQNSGEDWKNIQLTLSNGSPTSSSVKPTLQTWFIPSYSNANDYQSSSGDTRVTNLGFYGKVSQVSGRVVDEKTNEGIPFAPVMVKGTSIGTSTDDDGNFTMNLPADYSALIVQYLGYQKQEITNFSSSIVIKMNPNVQALEEVVVTGKIASKSAGVFQREDINNISGARGNANAIQVVGTNETLHATSISFDIQTPYTILSNGKFFTVEIKREDVPASYIYYAIPKLDQKVYLTAQIINWEDYNLLDGETSIYLEGTYMGSSLFDLQHASDTLELSLGVDKGVAIKRTKQKDFSKKQFIGNYKTEERAFEISVRNTKEQPIHLIVEDQLPVSTQSDIEVKQLETSGGKVDEATGKISWDLNVSSKSESKVMMHYSVKYLKSTTLILE